MKKMKAVKKNSVSFVICCLLLAGCGQKPAATQDTLQLRETVAETVEGVAKATEEAAEQEGLEETGEQEPSGNEEYGIVTIQNGDRTVIFTEMPQHVLCANLYSAENMAMLGLEDYIVGKNVAANPAEVPLKELAGALADVPEIERSHENAVAAEADLVIGQVSAFKENAWGTYEQLESKGIHALVITGTLVDDETVEHVYQDIENLGKIFKVEEKAEALIGDIQAQIRDTQDKVKDVAEEDKLTVFVFDSFNGNEIYTTSSGLESNLIELAGGCNVTKGMADSRWFNTSVETLVETNPDVLIVNDYGSQTVEEKLEFLTSNPALTEVPAIKDQRIMVIPLVSVMQDVRAASACQTIATYLYPECFE